MMNNKNNQNNPIEIILVEDNPDDVEMTLVGLKEHHLANCVRVLEDGEAALRYILQEAETCPRVILLDLKLPKIDGIEVLRRVRADKRAKLTPVVVLTSSSEERDRIESYKLGVNSYIVKPVNFDKFVKTVGEIGLYWVLLNTAPC